jgi:hypothetical protein
LRVPRHREKSLDQKQRGHQHDLSRMQAYDRKNDMAVVTRRRMKPSFLIWQEANLEGYRDMAVRTWKKGWEEGLRWKNMLVVGW